MKSKIFTLLEAARNVWGYWAGRLWQKRFASMMKFNSYRATEDQRNQSEIKGTKRLFNHQKDASRLISESVLSLEERTYIRVIHVLRYVALNRHVTKYQSLYGAGMKYA